MVWFWIKCNRQSTSSTAVACVVQSATANDRGEEKKIQLMKKNDPKNF